MFTSWRLGRVLGFPVEINLSFVVPYAQARNAVRALHRAFFQPAPADAAAEMQGP